MLGVYVIHMYDNVMIISLNLIEIIWNNGIVICTIIMRSVQNVVSPCNKCMCEYWQLIGWFKVILEA